MVEKVFGQLRQAGARLTKNRKAIVELIFAGDGPISAIEIGKALKKKNIVVNKTTVYRELDFLMKRELVREVKLEARKSYYESALMEHHHHLICNACGKVKKIRSKGLEKKMMEIEKAQYKKGFEILDHSLEFFGRCQQCR